MPEPDNVCQFSEIYLFRYVSHTRRYWPLLYYKNESTICKKFAVRLISLSVDNIRLELNLLSIKTNIDESFSMKIIRSVSMIQNEI